MNMKKAFLMAGVVSVGLLGSQAAHADWRGHDGYGGGYYGHGGYDRGYDRGHFYAGFGGGGYYPPPPEYYYPPPVYYAPPPVYYAPPVITFGFQP